MKYRSKLTNLVCEGRFDGKIFSVKYEGVWFVVDRNKWSLERFTLNESFDSKGNCTLTVCDGEKEIMTFYDTSQQLSEGFKDCFHIHEHLNKVLNELL